MIVGLRLKGWLKKMSQKVQERPFQLSKQKNEKITKMIKPT